VRHSYNGSREPRNVGRALLRTNRGRRGGQFTVSDSWVAELAAARDIAHMLCLKLDGYLERTGGGLITPSAPQRCKRISALRVGEAGVVLHVGGFDVLGRDRSGVPEAGAALAPPPARCSSPLATVPAGRGSVGGDKEEGKPQAHSDQRDYEQKDAGRGAHKRPHRL